MQETKYGMHPIKDILRECTKHGFGRMCIVYERFGVRYVLLFT
jgi:hypothetical protein